MTSPRGKRMDLAFAALLSDDDVQVLEALTRIGEKGDARAIPHLLKALVQAREESVRQRITALLNEVKTEGAIVELMAALEDPAFATIRPVILGVFWNAGLDVREHLDRFVDIAITGNAQECFECLTVIEHQEIWPEKAARLAAARVRKAQPAETDAYKAAMLRDLATVLEERLGMTL